MKNPLRNAMTACALVLAALVGVLLNSFGGGQAVEEAPLPEQRPIRMLAPFEIAAHKQVLADVAAAYSALPGKRPVEVRFVSQEMYQKEVCLQLEQGELADIILCENVAMPSLIGMGIYRDISPYVEIDRKFDLYYNILLHNTRSDGKYYGLPLTCDPYVLFYNRQALERKTLPPPKTWSELKDTSRAIQELGTYGLGIAAKQPEEVSALFLQLLYSTGASIRELNSDDALRLFALLSELYGEKSIPRDAINWSQADLAKSFMDGEVAMMMANISTASALEQHAFGFDVGVCPLPTDKKEVYLLHGKNVGITTAADPAAALDFLAYLTSARVTEQIARGTNTIPVRVDVEYTGGGTAMGLNEEFIQKQLHSSMAKSSFRSWFDISGYLFEGVYSLLGTGDNPAGAVADTMQDRVRVAIIDR